MQKRINKKILEYERKRDFKRTPEPKGNISAGKGNYSGFVIQKHNASRLHFDFRLETGGVLKSWAIPKNISLNPEKKNLAIQVEDHPYDYKNFEGIIPEGNYGAGTVMVWDSGAYYAIGSSNKFESEKAIEEGLKKGKISFYLEGKKIKGEFSLIRINGDADNWLLIKKKDRYANKEIKNNNLSIKTGRTMEEIERGEFEKGNFSYNLKDIDLRGAPLAKMPERIKPMLASLAKEPFNMPGWVFEIKWDGYRVMAKTGNGVKLYSRQNIDYSSRFPAIAESLKKVTAKTVLDGEVVALTSEGKADFQKLQNYFQTGKGTIVYYVFDILYLIKHDLTGLPLLRRKEILKKLISGLGPNIRFSGHIEENGISAFKEVLKNKIEGIMAKDGASRYEPGIRSLNWIKIKAENRQEAIICGFTEPRGGRKDLGALILGAYKNSELVYIGHAGTGFSGRSLKELRKKLNVLEVEKSPFKKEPGANAKAHWVRPELVCEVKFAEWTRGGFLRQPVFLGLREDKKAEEIIIEKPKPGILPGKANEQKKIINGRELHLTNLNKIYWPRDGYAKKDLLDYYDKIAPIILPYLKDRPETLNRFPNGIAEKNFYQKQAEDYFPDWMRTESIKSETMEKDIDYILCQNKASLIYLANLGCIEINPWNSKIGNLNRPDYLILDVDPGEAPFADAVRAALASYEILKKIKVKSFCKTSGATGLHIYIPLGAKYEYETARQFANLINILVNKRLPAFTTLERNPANRGRKVYLDYLQNRRGQTVASAYSVRPLNGAPVSTPLKWREVNLSLNPLRFNIKSIFKRLNKIGDIWGETIGPGIILEEAMERLEKELVAEFKYRKEV